MTSISKEEPKGSEPSSKPEPLCLCGHPWWAHEGPCETCKCQRYEADVPKCAHESWEVTREARDEDTGEWWKSRRCADCGEELDNVLEDKPTFGQEGTPEPEQTAPPRRPPYAVTYATPSRQFQILVPGDCSVTAADGALVIRCIEPVTGVTAVQPYYTEEG